MMESLYSQEKVDELREYEARKEARAEGRAEGIGIGEARGELNMLASLVRNNLLAKDIAAGQLGITEEEFDKRYKAYCVTDC